MYRIVKKEALKPTVILYEIEAPMVAKKAEPGQFIILRVDENGERIPITIHDYDREKGTVTIIVQTVGATTEKLSHKQQGECLHDFVGPLGKPTETEGKKKVCVVGGGVGCAIAYPVLKKFHDCGAEVHAVIGFKNKDLVILELGVGFANPGVIRFPFEKTAFFHQDSLLLRVNQTFPQTTEELKDRARGVHKNSVDWMIKSDYNVE